MSRVLPSRNVSLTPAEYPPALVPSQTLRVRTAIIFVHGAVQRALRPLNVTPSFISVNGTRILCDSADIFASGVPNEADVTALRSDIPVRPFGPMRDAGAAGERCSSALLHPSGHGLFGHVRNAGLFGRLRRTGVTSAAARVRLPRQWPCIHRADAPLGAPGAAQTAAFRRAARKACSGFKPQVWPRRLRRAC